MSVKSVYCWAEVPWRVTSGEIEQNAAAIQGAYRESPRSERSGIALAVPDDEHRNEAPRRRQLKTPNRLARG